VSVCLKEGEHVGKYRRILEHALRGEFEQLIVDVLGQEGVVIELDGGLFFSRKHL
jgi:hypothetical protein